MRGKRFIHLCRRITAAAVICGALASPSQGQELKKPPSHENYVPSVADLMGMAQLRHLKLWFAGRLENWELADYELAQVKASLQDMATLYPGISATDITNTAEPIRTIDQAIAENDSQKFAEGFRALTAACNSCHQGIGRGFILIQVPTASPFSNQSFAPPSR